MNIVGNQNNTNIKLTVFKAMQIVVKQIKLKAEESIMINPPILDLFKQKKHPINDIANVARLINGKMFNIILIAPSETAPMRTKTSQNI